MSLGGKHPRARERARGADRPDMLCDHLPYEANYMRGCCMSHIHTSASLTVPYQTIPYLCSQILTV